jgi:hypothetical protein
MFKHAIKSDKSKQALALPDFFLVKKLAKTAKVPQK